MPDLLVLDIRCSMCSRPDQAMQSAGRNWVHGWALGQLLFWPIGGAA